MKCIRDRCYSPVACGGFGYCRDLNDVLSRAEAMLRKHFQWTEGVYVRRPEAGRDEDLVIVSLPERVQIVDMADDLRDALKSLRGS